MQKIFKKNLKFIAQGLPKTQSTIIWLIGTLGVKSYNTCTYIVFAQNTQLYIEYLLIYKLYIEVDIQTKFIVLKS